MVKNLPANAGGQETRVQSLSQEDTLKQEIDPTPVFLPGKFHGQGSLEGYSPWGHKEPNMTEQLSVHTHTHTGTLESRKGQWNSWPCCGNL